MKTAKLLQILGGAGFTGEQAEALIEHFSQLPHTHTADQITDFDEAVTEIVESGDAVVADDEEDD